MASQLVAALLGALVGFAGTYLLQRGQWRRSELESVRQRLGALRALRIDLFGVLSLCKSSVDHGTIAPGTHYPDRAWITHGHLIIGAVNHPPLATLTDLFARLAPINSFLAARGPEAIELEADGAVLTTTAIQALADKADEAVIVLNLLEAEWEAKERLLRWPIRQRLNHSKTAAG